MAEYGEEKLITHIKQSTLGIYPAAYPGQDVYFTNKLIIDPGMAIIDYKKISMIYKHINKSQKTNAMYISIAFVLLDGGTYHLCGNPTDEQITKIMQLCYLHNPNILMGDTPQNREMHKINVKKYKSGQIVIPKVSLETTGAENEEAEQIADAVFSKKEYKGKVLPVPWEYTPEGNKYIVGKNLKCMGLFFAIGFLVMMLLTERVMFNPSNKTYETISGEKRTELLTDGYKEARIEGQYLRRFFIVISMQLIG